MQIVINAGRTIYSTQHSYSAPARETFIRPITAIDNGRICFQVDGKTFYILQSESEGLPNEE